VNHADGAQDVSVGHLLEKITARSGFKRPVDILIAIEAGQGDNARFRKLQADFLCGGDPVHIRQAQVHERDVGFVQSKQFHRFPAAGALGGQFHIGFIRQYGSDPFPN